jgi:hypothetical protein
MTIYLRVISTVVLLAMSLPAVTQTPLPNTQPKLTILWLASLTLAPTSVPAGTKVIGTVKLRRAAASNLVVALSLEGANLIEGNILAADGAVMSGSVTVPAGSSQATFTISTVKPTSAPLPKTYKVGGAYGAERISASFTLTAPTKLTVPRL